MIQTHSKHLRPKCMPGLFLLWAVCTLTTTGLAQTDIQHSLLIAGPNFTGIIDESGKATWDSGRKGARDAYLLASGNVLVAWNDVVREITRESKVVFEYKLSPDNSEIGTAQRLADGHTLVTELGKRPRLLEVDLNGKVVIEFALKPETDNAHMQTRMARKLANGNYLVPHLLAFKVKEYRADGEVVHELKTDLESLGGRAAENWPFTAIRLENGHTLTTLTHGNKVVEWNAADEVVWSLTNDDLGKKLLVDPCGAQRLPNGNTVIASYGATNGVKILEVNRAKQLVWTYDGPYRAHELQVLTTNGQPITGPLLK